MVTERRLYRGLEQRISGRAALGSDGGPSFTALASPKPATEISGWAARQFDELERVLKSQAEQIRELRAEIEALQGEVGNGTWDG